MTRRHWTDLPAPVRDAVCAHTGPVREAVSVAAGSVSQVAATLSTTTGPVFVKGISTDSPLVWMHRQEARVNPWLPGLAARLRWTVETGGWLLLGFEHVPGRHADAAPGSADLPLLADTLTVLSRTACPAVPVQAASTRWAGRINPGMVDGDTLVHSDVSLKNFLIEDGGVRVVDWATPCRGAAWLDTAWMIPRLVRAGHSPAAAEDWAARVPAWAQASPAAVTAFGEALAGLWEERQRRCPAAHRGPLAVAARAWARYRMRATVVV